MNLLAPALELDESALHSSVEVGRNDEVKVLMPAG